MRHMLPTYTEHHSMMEAANAGAPSYGTAIPEAPAIASAHVLHRALMMQSLQPQQLLIQALAATVAALCGASVSGQAAVGVQLNRYSSVGTHAVFVSAIGMAIGTVLLAAIALVFVRVPWGAPRSWWLLLGGVFMLPSFLSIPAAEAMGVQCCVMAGVVAR